MNIKTFFSDSGRSETTSVTHKVLKVLQGLSLSHDDFRNEWFPPPEEALPLNNNEESRCLCSRRLKYGTVLMNIKNYRTVLVGRTCLQYIRESFGKGHGAHGKAIAQEDGEAGIFEAILDMDEYSERVRSDFLKTRLCSGCGDTRVDVHICRGCAKVVALCESCKDAVCAPCQSREQAIEVFGRANTERIEREKRKQLESKERAAAYERQRLAREAAFQRECKEAEQRAVEERVQRAEAEKMKRQEARARQIREGQGSGPPLAGPQFEWNRCLHCKHVWLGGLQDGPFCEHGMSWLEVASVTPTEDGYRRVYGSHDVVDGPGDHNLGLKVC